MTEPTAFVPAHALVTAEGAVPSRWMLVLHGILGTGANLRGLARRLASARPAWGFVLVDLRMHGLSQGAPPPHTLAAAAEDLVHLEDALVLPIHGALGHSFGGKVALAYAARREHPLDELWILDSTPSARAGRDGGRVASVAVGILGMLAGFPKRFAQRQEFIDLVLAAGHERPLADWLATNLKHGEGGFSFRLDLGAIQALLESYADADLWPLIEQRELAHHVHVVVADRSDAFDERDRQRLVALAARDPRVACHVIPNAGHWVHVDAPDALFELVAASLA